MFNNKKIAFFGIVGIVVVMIAQQGGSNKPTAAEQTKLNKQAAAYETELYLKSPDGRKTRARLILSKQFPGWCQWSAAEMVVRSNGDVYARCNGATFTVDPTINIGMRFIDN